MKHEGSIKQLRKEVVKLRARTQALQEINTNLGKALVFEYRRYDNLLKKIQETK